MGRCDGGQCQCFGRPADAAFYRESHIRSGLFGICAASIVDIVETDNIIFTQIASRLHFNDLEVKHAGILQSMRRANGDIGRLVFGQQDHTIIDGNPGGAGHHDPVFGSMVVHGASVR